MLDNHLYWVMSYSRWQDEQFWPLFKTAFLTQLPELSESTLETVRKYNIEKYYYQGIGRYSKEEIYQSGIDDLQSIDFLLKIICIYLETKFTLWMLVVMLFSQYFIFSH